MHTHKRSRDAKLHKMMNPHINKGTGDLCIRVIQGVGLAKMDARAGLSDPYIELTFRGKTVKSTVVRGSLNPK